MLTGSERLSSRRSPWQNELIGEHLAALIMKVLLWDRFVLVHKPEIVSWSQTDQTRVIVHRYWSQPGQMGPLLLSLLWAHDRDVQSCPRPGRRDSCLVDRQVICGQLETVEVPSKIVEAAKLSG